MKKEEFIGRYGEVAYEKRLQQKRDWRAQHSKEEIVRSAAWRANNPEKTRIGIQEWRESHPDVVLAHSRERCRKGGKFYDRMIEYQRTGLRRERIKVRNKHQYRYRPFKQIIAPDSQIHHEWIHDTAEYTGVALVETGQHMHGFIDVIKIFEGKITLFTEKEIGEQK